ncbi:MAG TPA: AsmA family protein [Burkholderiales bacterium]|nr:AsmA family protein [Burkholderiales bacterium]
MKLLKWILISAGGLVVLCAAGLAFIAATFDPNQYKGQIADLVQEKTHRTLTIEGDIKLSLFPTLGVQLGKTRLSELSNPEEFAALEQMRVSLALIPLLSKEVVVDEVQLDGLRVNLVKYRDGKTNFDDLLGAKEAAAPTPAPAPPSATPIKFDIDGVKVSKASLNWKDETAGTTYTVSDLKLKTGRVAPGIPVEFELSAALSASQPKMEVKLQCSGTLTADPQRQNFSVALLNASVGATGPQLEALLNIKLSGMEASARAVQVGEMLVTLDAKQGNNAVKGTLSTPLAADLENQVIELSKLAGKFDVVSPALPMQKLTVPLTGTVRADLRKQTVHTDLTARVDESTIKAKVDLTDFAAPFTRFDIAIDKFDLDRFLPPAKKRAAGTEPARPPQTEQPIDFSPIKTLNLAGSLGIDELIASNVKAQSVRMDLKASGGRLDVNPLSAGLYQGKIRGAISVNAHNNQLAIKQNLSGVAVGPLLRDALQQDLLEGLGDVVLDLTATGNTVSAIKKSLNGTAALNLKDGAIKGINLARSLRNAKALLTGGKRETEHTATAGEQTDFAELTGSFVIRDGVAHNDDLLAKSPFLRLTGAGDIDIAQGSLNYLAKAAVVATSAGQGGKEMDDLKGLMVPVRASGPFAALKYKLEFGSAFSDSAKQQLDVKKEELKEKLEDKLKSRLPGAEKPAGEAAPPATEEGAPAENREDKFKEKLEKKLKKVF